MTVNPGEVIRCAVRQDFGGNDLVNVFEFQHGGVTNSDEADVLTAVASYFDTAYATMNARISNLITPVDIKVDVVEVISGVKKVTKNVGVTLWGSSYSPAAAGERLPSGIAVLVRLLTSVGKVFGRKYLGGLVESDVGGNGLVAVLATAAANFVAAVLNDMLVGGSEFFHPGVLSVSQDHPGEFLAFTDGDVNQNVAYQRRRAPGVGS